MRMMGPTMVTPTPNIFRIRPLRVRIMVSTSAFDTDRDGSNPSPTVIKEGDMSKGTYKTIGCLWAMMQFTCVLLFIVFLVAKLVGVDLNWILVVMPLIVGFAVSVIFFGGSVVAELVIQKKKGEK